MDSRNKKLKQLLTEWDIQFIDENTASRLKHAVAPISESYFRKILRNSGIPLAPLVEGVRQETLEHLERSLLALVKEDEAACRSLVLLARKHALLAQQREHSIDREEKIMWLTVWLENREIFPEWLKIRKQKLDENIPHDTAGDVR